MMTISPSRRAHLREHGPDAVVHARGVDVHRLVPGFRGHVGHGPLGIVDAGARDQDVDPAQLVVGPGEEPLDARAIGHVGGVRQRLGRAFPLGQGFLKFALAAAGDGHAGAGFGQTFGDGQADARCAAGDECGFAFEFHGEGLEFRDWGLGRDGFVGF